MVGHHWRCIAAHFLGLSLVFLPVGLDLPVGLIVALLDLGVDCAWFEGRSVHFGVVGAGVLRDVLDGVGLGHLEG